MFVFLLASSFFANAEIGIPTVSKTAESAIKSPTNDLPAMEKSQQDVLVLAGRSWRLVQTPASEPEANCPPGSSYPGYYGGNCYGSNWYNWYYSRYCKSGGWHGRRLESSDKSLQSGTAPSNAGDSSNIWESDDDYAKEVLRLINAERKAAGIGELVMDKTLTEAAAVRAKEALANPDLKHTRPDGSGFQSVLTQLGYKYGICGENLIFATYTMSAQAAYDGWKNSKGHHDNYMNPSFKYCGLVFINDGSQSYYSYAGAHIFA